MESNERQMLERLIQVTEENNLLLRKIHRGSMIAMYGRFAYWAILIVLFIGSYYVIKPYIQDMLSLTDSIGNFRSLLGQ
jgi:hypothetical protein